MMPAAKNLDPVMGIDVHIVQPPGPVPPIPVPHPFIGMLFDPMDFIPILGKTVMVNSMPCAIAGTAGKGVPPHIPIGGVFVKPPSNECEMFMGSATVSFDGDAASYLALPALSCQDIGIPAPPRSGKKKKTKTKSLVLPTSVVLAIPMGMPVLIGGPPTISLMGMAQKLGMAALGKAFKKFTKSKLFKRAKKAFNKAKKKACKNMKPGFIKCKVLKAEPVNIITGEVVVEQQDWTLPWRIPLDWTRRYSSHDDRPGLCGHGWGTPADARITIDADGIATFYDGGPGASVFPTLPTDGAVTELVDGGTLERDGRDLLVRTKDGLTYRCGPPTTSSREALVDIVTDRSGNSIRFVRSDGVLTEIRESSGQRIEVGTTNGRITEMTLIAADPTQPHRLVRYEYSEQGDLAAMIDAMGGTYRFTYSEHRLLRHTDRNGLSFHYEYDNLGPTGRCLHAWGDGGLYDYHFEYTPGRTRAVDSLGNISFSDYNRNGQIEAETDPLGGVTSYEYDEAGRASAVVDPMGKTTLYEYDSNGNTIAVTRADGTIVRAAYNEMGRATEITDPNGGSWGYDWNDEGLIVARTSPRGATWAYEYNELGDLVCVTDPLGNTTRYEIDASGNLKGLINALGDITMFRTDMLGNVVERMEPGDHKTSYRYDAKGRLVAVVNPSGSSQGYSFDWEDNLISTRDENGNVTRLFYTGLSELSERINPDGTHVRYRYDTEERLLAVINERDEEYTFERDTLGRVVAEIDYWGNATRYSYNASGDLIQSIDPLNRRVGYGFDPLGRLLEKYLHEGTTERFAYDANGNLVRAENWSIVVQRNYDEDGNIVEEKQGDFSVWSEYDQMGNRLARRSTTGNEIRYEYDALGNPIGLDLNDAPISRMKRDARGLVVHEQLNERLERNYAYDADGRLIHQQLRRDTRPIIDRGYRYDPTGNLLERSDQRKGTTAYSYDPMSRITQQTDPTGAIKRFDYDPAGNLLRPVDAERHASGGRTERYGERVYTFDAAGNLILRKTPEGETTFRWDSNNRLIGAVNEKGEVLAFEYDAFARRISKKVDATTIRFFWDGDTMLQERKDDLVTHETVFYPRSFRLLATVEGNLKYVENDQVGVPNELVNASGEIDWSLEELFPENGSNQGDIPYKLQGQYYDEEIGLCYNRFRYFDPSVDRFASQDPLGLFAGVNLYRFAPNIGTWIDPYGLNCSSDAKKLRQNMHAAGKVEPSHPNAAHHVVMSNSPDMATTRAHLAAHGIDINDASNGVFLPRGTAAAQAAGSSAIPHSTLHTDLYKQEVQNRITSQNTAAGIKNELNNISNEILNGTFPH